MGLFRAMSSEVLNTPTEGDPTASLGSLLQGLTILMENNFFLIPNGNFPRCNSCPLSCCFFGSAPVSLSPLTGSYLGICKRWQTSHAQIHQVLRKWLRPAVAHEGRGHMGWESVPTLRTLWSQPWPAAQDSTSSSLWLMARIASELWLLWKDICLSASHLD